MSDEITIRPLQSTREFRACEGLQQRVWQVEPIETVPSDLLITAQRHGGLVLGAFADEELVGLLFGFPGRVAPDNPAAAGPTWQHCSHLLAVLPEWQGRGIGYRLKLAQREWALGQGYDLVTWTYDPLQAANAVLNLGKLGAVCRCYLPDAYGPMADALNAGMPSDRFEVAWWVRSERVRERVDKGWRSLELADLLEAGARIMNPAGRRADASPLAPAGERVLIEIPASLREIKASTPTTALAWQTGVRETCLAAFAAGYTAVDVVRATVERVPRVYYLLVQEAGPRGQGEKDAR